MASESRPFELDAIREAARKRADKLRALPTDEAGRLDIAACREAEEEGRTEVRGRLIPNRDALAMERVLGDNNFFHVNYFEHALGAVRAVCKIHIMDRFGVPQGAGTGFLVGSGLVLTNNHVLSSAIWAESSHLEFEFEYDGRYRVKRTTTFELDPEALFFTDDNLDFTFVAVATESADGADLDDFGSLLLIADSGKALAGEPVTIIQHPNGGLKRAALRDSRIIGIAGDPPDDHFLHYTTDTDPGASGSPVLNDQWQVVALHHSSVPGPGNTWVANEGVRISRIYNALRAGAERDPEAQAVLRRLDEAIVGEPSARPAAGAPVAAPAVEEAAPFKPRRWGLDDGYKPEFLGNGVNVPLPLPRDMGDVAESADGEVALRYTHFSVVMSESRRLAYVAATNIDGSSLIDITRGRDKWRLDPRLAAERQIDNTAYKHNDFDRGHLVRRLSPVWGETREEAQKANDDTFHYTNCAPQHKKLNQRNWLDLEKYILKTTDREDVRACVFTGPVFRPDDRLYRGEFLIPESYWKIAVMLDDDGRLASAGYLQTQKDLVGDVTEAAFGDYKTYRVPVTTIAMLTGLDLDLLVAADPRSRSEAAAGVSEITGAAEGAVY